MVRKPLIVILCFTALLGATSSASAALPDLASSSGWYKHLVEVTNKITANPKAYKKDRPNGYKWATKNLKKDLDNLKSTIWKRYSTRLTNDSGLEKKTYDRLTYDEAIRHALSMAALDPLVKKSKVLVNNISVTQAFKCRASFNKKSRNKKKALRAYRKKLRKCNLRKSALLKNYRTQLFKLNAQLEPARQEKVSAHLAKIEGINNWMAGMRVILRNVSNSSTVLELQEATKIANKGRAAIGLSLLPLPEPKMNSVNPAQSEFWSMMAAGEFNYSRAAQAGVGTMRGFVYSPGIMNKGGAYTWGGQDGYFKRIASAGIRTIPVLCDTSPDGKRFAGPSDSNWKQYKTYVKAMVKRYGPGGEFWKQNRSIPYMPITTWEICNEPNLKFFVPSKRIDEASISSYRRYLVGVSQAIKSADKQAIVLVGGLANIQGAKMPFGISGSAFLSRLYKYPEARASFDGVAFHPYAGDVTEMADSIKRIRNIMDSNGDSGKIIHITEVGWATGGDDKALSVSPQKQADNLTEALTWFKDNKASYKIGSVAWYFWQDVSQPIIGTKVNWDSHAGLFDVNGQPKPSWYAFLRITGGQ